jgi:uncharacterized SAM-binding protein YcdF (DUF218 family)
MNVFITNAVSALLLPPLNLVLVCAAGVMLCRARPRLGRAIALGALLLLVLFSTPAGSLLLAAPLERYSVPLTPVQAAGAGAQAIVVLGAGQASNQPEYGGNAVPTQRALVRLRYAARLQRETGLPLLTSGGTPNGLPESEAAIMARVLRQDFGVPVKWVEDRSDNTAENALLSAAMLRSTGVRRILLVTDALHMPRAQRIFEKAGFQVISAPTWFLSRARLTLQDFLPSGAGLNRSHYALHEWIGLLWYELRHRGIAAP